MRALLAALSLAIGLLAAPTPAQAAADTNLAAGKPATAEMIHKACADAGVPKEMGTVKTIISDFMQTYAALQQAGLVKAIA